MHVLIVDDDIALRKMINIFVEKLGHTTAVAANAWEALEPDGINAAIDAVITDVQMPGGNGIELLQMLWRFEPTPPTYVHSSESYFYFNGGHLELPSHIATVFGEFASFKPKDDHTLKNIQAFLRSIPAK